ncbi:P-loop containing nucleoside triphosphate hydrolase protein [Phyllosticta citrichinensis]|uniref:P-loop containing nucleoside triphosphate hydrolase protein n=1 Tax=Phyllosticta citrichinensis TaxID=1130410 RepID=A0ABR1XHW7_9PEZI
MSTTSSRPKKAIKKYFSDGPSESTPGSLEEGWSMAPPRRRIPPAGQSSRQTIEDSPSFNPTSDEEVNPGIAEKFANRRPEFKPHELSRDIQQYISDSRLPVNTSSWLSKPEIPSSDEILDESQGDEDMVTVYQNKVDGPWDSKEGYLESHFELLREDSILPLRQAVGRIRCDPWHKEEVYGTSVGLYEKVRVVAVKFAGRGLAVKVRFSLSRSGKRVHWAQSKRLLAGSLVALTTEDDKFQSICKMATIAARPQEGLELNPPQVELFFARPEDVEIDPGTSFWMVEERSSFLEASRHTLRALQKLMREPFPMMNHLVYVDQTVSAPSYVIENPFTDLRAALDAECPERIDILNDWREDPPTELDKTQLQSLNRILTKRLAVVQGPPGTGKTHVSVVALKVLLQNLGNDGPPIIVACHTNHALDQLLRHVAQFEPEFARLGGRSKDVDVIKKRTLFELRQAEKVATIPGGMKMPAILRQRDLEKEMKVLLSPLEQDVELMSHKVLHRMGLLNEWHVNSLESPPNTWVTHGSTGTQSNDSDPIEQWLGKQVEHVIGDSEPDDFGFEYEEVDLELEQLKEIEAETGNQDEDFEKMPGNTVNLADRKKGKETGFMEDAEIQAMLDRETNLYKIKSRLRGLVYNYLKRKAKSIISCEFREIAKTYYDAAVRRTAGRWEEDLVLLRKQKIIGMTTTGFSKYRALVSALKPKVVLIEEAAETLEAPVAVTCVPTLQHLILVGDHQQLRPHCQVREYEEEPFNLNMSLFERLVKNGVEYDTLRRQRRMIPEVRRLLQPIYGDLIADHPVVKDLEYRPPVPGMGGVNSFFFTHEWEESRDSSMSTCNDIEASMVVKFYEYLYMNGIEPDNITVLTFYNGQRKLLLQKLRSSPNFRGIGRYFKVVTVDSYQGEENDVVILSLARSNDKGTVGFLDIKNRVCVALSRARRGFYLFGNGEFLASESKIWAQVITIMAGKAGAKLKTDPQMRLGYYLPVMCKTHGRKTFLAGPEDFEYLNGGCEMKCQGKLPCGHKCHLRCHPFPHEVVICTRPCLRDLICGHICQESSILKPGTHLGRPNDPKPGIAPPQSQTPAPAPASRIAAVNCAPPKSEVNTVAAWQAYPANVRQHDAEQAAARKSACESREAEGDERLREELERKLDRMVVGDGEIGNEAPLSGPPSPPLPSEASTRDRVYHSRPSASGRVKYTETYVPGRGGGGSGSRRKDGRRSQSEQSLLD